MLADGRLPAGGHAHSGGVEAAVQAGRVRDLIDLGEFLRGRLATTGLVCAAFAAAACQRSQSIVDCAELDMGLDARTPSPALRKASRAQGRALLRVGRHMWTVAPLAGHPDGPHHPVALGVVAAAAGLDPGQAALIAAHGAVSGPASAAVRLLSLDPYAVQAQLAGLASACDQTAERAASFAGAPVDTLPANGAPLLDIGAEIHASWEVRLFAS
jgi:urease accessory protein